MGQTMDILIVDAPRGSVNIVNALRPGVQRIRALGQVLHCGRRLVTAAEKPVGADGTLCAHGTSACLLVDLPNKRQVEDVATGI